MGHFQASLPLPAGFLKKQPARAKPELPPLARESARERFS
jgi:hypothetical protein